MGCDHLPVWADARLRWWRFRHSVNWRCRKCRWVCKELCRRCKRRSRCFCCRLSLLVRWDLFVVSECWLDSLKKLDIPYTKNFAAFGETTAPWRLRLWRNTAAFLVATRTMAVTWILVLCQQLQRKVPVMMTMVIFGPSSASRISCLMVWY